MKYIASLLFLLLLAFHLIAQNTLNTITTAVPFLMITPDARAGGLGDAGCASSPDVHANFWNAAKNAFAESDFSISASYTPWLRALVPDMNLFDLSLYKNLGKNGVVGFSSRYFSRGDIALMTMGQFRAWEHTESISYSTKMGQHFSGGGAIKYIYSNLTGNVVVGGTQTHPGQSVAADISGYYTDTFKIVNDEDIFSLGVNISNIGSKISYSNAGNKDFIPQNLRAGGSYKIQLDSYNSIEVLCDANRLLLPLPAFNNSLKENLKAVNIASGIEYWYAQLFAARGGFFFEHPDYGGRKYLTFGIGVRYAGLGLDVSYLLPTEQRHPLQNTVRFTLQCKFLKIKKKTDSPNFIEG